LAKVCSRSLASRRVFMTLSCEFSDQLHEQPTWVAMHRAVGRMHGAFHCLGSECHLWVLVLWLFLLLLLVVSFVKLQMIFM
jgi:hypothetical protein